MSDELEAAWLSATQYLAQNDFPELIEAIREAMLILLVAVEEGWNFDILHARIAALPPVPEGAPLP